MALSKEELLRPRIKMIAPVPENGMKVGSIITINDNSIFQLTPTYGLNLTGIREYPHIYKTLAWWEDRNITDMPQFIRVGTNGIVRIAHQYHLHVDQVEFVGGKKRKIKHYNPSSKEEYTTYLNTLNK